MGEFDPAWTPPDNRASGEFSRLPGGVQLWGRYAVRSCIGAGAMGTVYLAERMSDRGAVAVKVEHFDDEQLWRGRLEREAIALRSVVHRNVATVLEHGVLEDGRVAVVFEYVDGESMARVLRWSGGALPWRRVRDIALALLEGVASVHDAGVLHRDIKPSNVLLVRGEASVKLIDFGFCKSESLGSITLAGEVLGTPEFMAPERCNGEPHDLRSDLYSVAVLIYTALTGELPFGEGGMRSMLSKAAGVEAKALRCPPGFEPWPAALDAVIARALRFAPSERFSSARAFADALRAAVS